MRSYILWAPFLAASLSSVGQSSNPIPQALPKDPHEIFAAAQPFYSFNDGTLKPWHLKASYQLYDEAGNPTERGAYEYWWVSPQVNRSSWARPSASHSDWHTADGKHEYQATGEALNYFEYKVQSAFLSPLPDAGALDSANSRLDRQTVTQEGVKMPCVMVVPHMPQDSQKVPLGLFPTYCFDLKMPVLRVEYSWGAVAMEFNRIVKFQDRFLARQIDLFEGKRRILSATVDSINGIAPSDPALNPDPNALVASKYDAVELAAGVATGRLLKKQAPAYPQDALQARVSGTVVLQATIGLDGGVHELRVVSAPSPSLVPSALWAVSHWQYRPLLFDGEPVEVRTTINVIFMLGR